MKRPPPTTIKQFRDLLSWYPDDAELRFIARYDKFGPSVSMCWEQDEDPDPATDYSTIFPGLVVRIAIREPLPLKNENERMKEWNQLSWWKRLITRPKGTS